MIEAILSADDIDIERSDVCTIPHCGSPAFKGSKCREHFNEYLETGRIEPGVYRYNSLAEQVLAYTLINVPVAGCWGWAGPVQSISFTPRVKFRGNYITARNAIWRIYRPSRPPHRIYATCGTPHCINPSHLVRKASTPRRRPKPDRKLDPRAASMIKRLYLERHIPAREIADLYNISPAYVYRIANEEARLDAE